jgi:hypothetical protein
MRVFRPKCVRLSGEKCSFNIPNRWVPGEHCQAMDPGSCRRECIDGTIPMETPGWCGRQGNVPGPAGCIGEGEESVVTSSCAVASSRILQSRREDFGEIHQWRLNGFFSRHLPSLPSKPRTISSYAEGSIRRRLFPILLLFVFPVYTGKIALRDSSKTGIRET